MGSGVAKWDVLWHGKWGVARLSGMLRGVAKEGVA